jgi:putative transposase
VSNKAIVFRLYPNKKQKEQLQKTFGCTRFVYNQMLTVQEDRYKNDLSHLSKFSANAYCNQTLKKNFEWLKEVDKFAITNSIYHLEDGYTRFFNKLGKKPKYKNKHKAKKSYTTNYTSNNIEIGSNYIKLPKLKKVKAKIHRSPDTDWIIKSATVTQNRDNTYQVSVLFEYKTPVISKALVSDNTVLGLDYKSDGLYVDSNGNKADMPHYYRKSQNNLAKQQRKLKHKVVSSNNYYKQQLRVAKTHRHTANQRKDYLHKKSTEIANRYSYVIVEDLDMKAMSNKGFGNGKATLDNGNGMFLTMLDYKLKDRGGQLVKIDKWFPSSQLCCNCGYRNPQMKDLSIRVYKCPICGMVKDRDYNSAINIKKEGIRLLTVA